MKTLPTSYAVAKYGFQYELVERNPVAGIYAHTATGEKNVRCYEVCLVTFMEAKETERFKVEAGEHLANTSQWGQRAWSCQRLERAQEKMRKESTAERLAVAEKFWAAHREGAAAGPQGGPQGEAQGDGEAGGGPSEEGA